MTRHPAARDRARTTAPAILNASLSSLVSLIAEQAARNTLNRN